MRARRLILVIVIIIALPGCKHDQNSHSSSSQPAEKQTAKPASTLDFSHALIGHWESIDGKEQYYISSTEVTSYFTEEDRLGVHRYIILYQYPKSRTIEIRGQTQGSIDFKEINDTKLVFSADFKMAETYHRADLAKFLESIGREVAPSDHNTKYSQSGSWRYVDDKQKP